VLTVTYAVCLNKAHYAECRYPECRGAAYIALENVQNTFLTEKSFFESKREKNREVFEIFFFEITDCLSELKFACYETSSQPSVEKLFLAAKFTRLCSKLVRFTLVTISL